MAIDVLLKKYFWLVVLGAIGVAAYFQASGIGALTGAALETGVSTGSNAGTPAPDVKTRSPSKSGEAILARNPFDSVTGPLDTTPAASAPLSSATGVTDPLRAPACSGVHVHIVTEADDPAWSRAALQSDGDDKPVVYRVGDKIGDRTIAYIGYNPRERSPAVWLESGSALCQALLFTDSSPAASAAAPPPAPPPVPSTVKLTLPTGPRQAHKAQHPVDPKLAARIRKLSTTQVRVSPAAVDDILSQPDQLMPKTGVLPESESGKVMGIRVFGIRNNTLLGELGLQSGDRVESVGGVKVTSPDKAIEGWDKMRGGGPLKVKVTRQGHPVTLDIEVR